MPPNWPHSRYFCTRHHVLIILFISILPHAALRILFALHQTSDQFLLLKQSFVVRAQQRKAARSRKPPNNLLAGFRSNTSGSTQQASSPASAPSQDETPVERERRLHRDRHRQLRLRRVQEHIVNQ